MEPLERGVALVFSCSSAIYIFWSESIDLIERLSVELLDIDEELKLLALGLRLVAIILY